MNRFFKLAVAGTATILGLNTSNNNMVEAKCSKYGDCKRIDMVGYLSVEDMGWTKDTICTSNWGWVDDRTGKRYIILSCEPGHSLIDISEPSKPKAVARLVGEQGGNFRWRDVKVYKNFAYMVSDALLSRVQVLDLQAAVDGRADHTYELPLDDGSNANEYEGNGENENQNGGEVGGGNGSNGNEPNEYEDSEYEDDGVVEFDHGIKKHASNDENEYGEDRRRALRGKAPLVKATTVYKGGGIYQSHNIEINEESGYAYAVGGGNNCNNGMHIIDLRNPGYPKFVGCFSHPSNPYIHDAHCRSYTKDHLDGKYAGREICFAFAVNAVISVDVTDKKNPKTLSVLRYDGASYVHQGWATTDRKFLVVDDERDQPGVGIKTFVVDIRDLDNLKLAHIHVAVGETFGDHNQYVVPIGKHDYTFQANYAGGLRVLRINRGPVKGRSDDEILSLEEVAYFDANPSNGNQMEGVWSVYPFFTEDRLVAFADMDTGFYVVRWEFEDTDPAIPYKALNGAPTPSPTSWANCYEIKSESECKSEVACMWDWDWQMVQGWTQGCAYAPMGSMKPVKPYRAPQGGAKKCNSLNKSQCNLFPACYMSGGKCKPFPF